MNTNHNEDLLSIRLPLTARSLIYSYQKPKRTDQQPLIPVHAFLYLNVYKEYLLYYATKIHTESPCNLRNQHHLIRQTTSRLLIHKDHT